MKDKYNLFCLAKGGCSLFLNGIKIKQTPYTASYGVDNKNPPLKAILHAFRPPLSLHGLTQ